MRDEKIYAMHKENSLKITALATRFGRYAETMAKEFAALLEAYEKLRKLSMANYVRMDALIKVITKTKPKGVMGLGGSVFSEELVQKEFDRLWKEHEEAAKKEAMELQRKRKEEVDKRLANDEAKRKAEEAKGNGQKEEGKEKGNEEEKTPLNTPGRPVHVIKPGEPTPTKEPVELEVLTNGNGNKTESEQEQTSPDSPA